MKALYKKTFYTLTNGKWQKISEELTLRNASTSEWEKMRLVGDRIISNCGLVWSCSSRCYNNKIKYEKIGSFIYENRGSQLFDKLDKLTTQQFNLLRNRAKRTARQNGIDFENEACFISSSSVNGYYLPNNRNNQRVIAFINSKAYLFDNDLLNEILDY